MKQRAVQASLAFLSAALVFLASGCSSNNKGKIEGTKWLNEAATVKGAALPAGIMVLEFGADASLKWAIGPQVLTGKYSLGSGDTVTFDMDKELSGAKRHRETITIVGDKLTLSDPTGTIHFKRMSEK